MGRIPRVDVGNVIYHVINRGNFRSPIFEDGAAYENFMDIVAEALLITPMRILAYCLMPNHWHMVLYPEHDGDLSRFMQRVTLTHTQRYHARTKTRGYGHIYQGRYKSFPVENDRYFLNLVRYVERNAMRAALVERAEDWQWSSAHIRAYGTENSRKLLSPWPIDLPDGYVDWLNDAQSAEEVEAIRNAMQRSKPYGGADWTAGMVKKFSLENSVRDPWRPKKST